MSTLSPFSRTILGILDLSRRPLSTDEITLRVKAKQPEMPVRGRVRPYLQHALNQYVTYLLEADEWVLKPKHKGEFADAVAGRSQETLSLDAEKENHDAVSDQQASDSGESVNQHIEPSRGGMKENVPDDDISDEDEGSAEVDAVSRAIVGLLQKSISGLKAADIADLIAFSGKEITRTDVNRRLYGELGDRVIQVDNYQWVLVDASDEEAKSPSDANGLDDTESEIRTVNNPDDISDDSDKEVLGKRPVSGGDIGSKVRSLLAELRERSSAQRQNDTSKSEERSNASIESHDSSPSDRDYGKQSFPIRTKPGEGAELVRKLDLASAIVRALNLFKRPLLSRQIEKLLAVMGTHASQADIKSCLGTTLKPYVKKDGEGWLIRTGQDGSGQSQQQEMKDGATRAHVSSLNYNYVFDETDIDGALLFSSDVRGGDVQIRLNRNHPAYPALASHIDNERVGYSAVELLIISWVEMESDLKARRQDLAEHFRDNWGRALRRIIKQNAEDE